MKRITSVRSELMSHNGVFKGAYRTINFKLKKNTLNTQNKRKQHIFQTYGKSARKDGILF